MLHCIPHAQVDPDDEDMVMLHIIPAEDCKREKGVFTKDKLNLYLKNVVELDGPHFKVSGQGSTAIVQIYCISYQNILKLKCLMY